jgi:two-component system NtrC family response regulator
MADGTFREDLYYRLAVVKIVLPPLRDREDDIRLLSQFFLQHFAEPSGKPGLAFDQEALRGLSRNAWPGNVRQLENCIRRAVIMAEGKRVTLRDLELPASTAGSSAQTLKEAREQLEKEMIQNSLRKHGGKIAPAAVELGISRPTLYDLMDKLGIAKE